MTNKYYNIMYICFKTLLGRLRSSVVELNRNAVDQGHGDISESEQFLTPWAHLRFNKVMRAIIHRFQGLVQLLTHYHFQDSGGSQKTTNRLHLIWYRHYSTQDSTRAPS